MLLGITGDQLWAHVLGDYVVQSDWMAMHKRKSLIACGAHAISYGFGFWIIGATLIQLVFIVGTHFVIDHLALARYLCWFKNKIWAWKSYPSFAECDGTGYPNDRDAWMTVWLYIADNLCHVTCNAVAFGLL